MKRLIFRLSSLGDLILAQSVLEPPFAGDTHWVVAKEFDKLVVGNPKITRIWSYDRKERGGLIGWISFLKELPREEFDEVLDLHSTLRTAIARIYFRIFAPKVRWKKVSKERLRRLGYEIFKQAWPAPLRPTHFSRKCARLAGGYGNERPNMRWLLPVTSDGATRSDRIAVVPASAWPGKEWPTVHYLEWAKLHLRANPQAELILLGLPTDLSAVALRDALVSEKVAHLDGIGKYDLSALGGVLATCTRVVGSDTGLLHLAEALGIPVVTIFGPTRADFGFGPLDERSKPVQPGLWCSPCSKDGSLCFRPIRRYHCLRQIESRAVESALNAMGPTGKAPT